MNAPIRVCIVEDDPLTRQHLAHGLATDPQFLCADVFASAEELLACKHLRKIDVFLIDVGLPGMSGIDAIRELESLDVPGQILVLTIFDDDHTIRDAVVAGARGYLIKTVPRKQLMNAIIEIHEGGAPLSSQAARVIMDFVAQLPRPNILDRLTVRERDVLALLAQHKQYKEIADDLFMSIDTVRTHVRSIYRKLKVHRRGEAERMYREAE
jgi:DNA-binding NarL/FixJ family response regulator